MKNKWIISLTLLIVLVVSGCDRSKLSQTSMDQFKGTWKITGGHILDNCVVIISKDKDEYVGRLNRINENKLVQFFCDSSMVVFIKLERKSNFQFYLTEKKVGAELMSLYGLSTSETHEVRFEGKNTIVFYTSGENATKTGLKLIRIR